MGSTVHYMIVRGTSLYLCSYESSPPSSSHPTVYLAKNWTGNLTYGELTTVAHSYATPFLVITHPCLVTSPPAQYVCSN